MSDRDDNYLAFIRSQPCLIPGCGFSPCDPHHQPRAGHGSTALKCSDYRAVPLCRFHHDEYGRISRKLYADHGIEIELVIAGLNSRYFFAHDVAYIENGHQFTG